MILISLIVNIVMVKVEIDAMELPPPKQDYRDEIRALIKTDRTILDKVIHFIR